MIHALYHRRVPFQHLLPAELHVGGELTALDRKVVLENGPGLDLFRMGQMVVHPYYQGIYIQGRPLLGQMSAAQ